MEVMVPFNDVDNFDFHSARSTPFASPPSTPKPFSGDFYFSAPPSPTHLSPFYREFDSLFIADAADDEKVEVTNHVDEFAFDVSQELEIGSVSAEDLFDGGIIKPSTVLPTRGMSKIGFSPNSRESSATTQRESRRKQRVLSNGLLNSSSRRSARSLSPIRNSQYPWKEEEEEENEEMKKQSSKSNSSTCSILSCSSSKGGKKWRFKDFFLFRSASEGRASDKDPLKKYTVAGYREGKHSSSKGKESTVSSSSSSKSIVTTRKSKKGKISAHELHYTVNRALSSDLKKRTFLPYKQGILGQLAFNPAVHALANGFGLSRK
ncbi:unnamed protein product [Withania somnifera]